jgi:hypothetical protein
MVLDFSNVFYFKFFFLENFGFFKVFSLFFRPPSPIAARAHRTGQKARTAPTRLLQKKSNSWRVFVVFLTSHVGILTSHVRHYPGPEADS